MLKFNGDVSNKKLFRCLVAGSILCSCGLLIVLQTDANNTTGRRLISWLLSQVSYQIASLHGHSDGFQVNDDCESLLENEVRQQSETRLHSFKSFDKAMSLVSIGK